LPEVCGLCGEEFPGLEALAEHVYWRHGGEREYLEELLFAIEARKTSEDQGMGEKE
jgi:hypothetical protein